MDDQSSYCNDIILVARLVDSYHSENITLNCFCSSKHYITCEYRPPTLKQRSSKF